MKPFTTRAFALAITFCGLTSVLAQTQAGSRNDEGYIGYTLEQNGDPEAAVYQTSETDTSGGIELPEDPDVYLNASVSVDEISIEVENITAKVNLDAQVLKLLHFTAGVDASIDRVKLKIQNVSAKVELEARLGNLLQMVNDVLDSIDLNPIVATLGSTVKGVINDTVGVITDPVDEDTGLRKRSLEYHLAYNILYSVNNYGGHNHRNRVLAQNGTMYDIYLSDRGDELSRSAVGYYSRDMTFTGHNKTISIDGEPMEFEMQYVYQPYMGLDVVSLVYMDAKNGRITRTKVVAGLEGGGTTTFKGDSDA